MKLLGMILLGLAQGAALIGLAAAGAWSFRVAVADHLASTETASGLEQAIAQSPGQSLNYVRLSALLSETDPRRAVALLQTAVALNPLDSRSWIDLGLRREMDGDLALAERDLLRAASVDRQYLPRWSLANYYFRRGDAPRFWGWARQAVEMLYGDPEPLFRLCRGVDEDANLVERLALPRPDVRAQYLAYLLRRSKADLIHPVAQRVLSDGREADVPVLLAACDRLLELQRVDEAIGVWDRLAAGRQTPYGRMSMPGGDAITNGSFSSAPSSHGFDWRVPDTNGVSNAREDEQGGMRLTFSGSQPEACVPLSQLIPVTEATRYRVEYRYSTSKLADNSGLAWQLQFAGGSEAEPITAPIPAEEKEGTRVLWFDTPPGCRLVRLSLAYRRATGTTRIEGRIVLKQVRMSRAGQSD